MIADQQYDLLLHYRNDKNMTIATALEAYGIYICDRTVSRILKGLGYALHVNHKQLSATKHPQRNQQFHLIALLRNYASPLSV